jgi:hypothetical protein
MERLGDNHLLGRLYPPRLGMPDLVVSFVTRSRTTQRCNHASPFLAFGLNPDTGCRSKAPWTHNLFFRFLVFPLFCFDVVAFCISSHHVLVI